MTLPTAALNTFITGATRSGKTSSSAVALLTRHLTTPAPVVLPESESWEANEQQPVRGHPAHVHLRAGQHPLGQDQLHWAGADAGVA
ncbi:MAG: hypothetical protein K2V38_20145 [Gemmataceae bacterium]|nr:hypothetical protein [Gemmataceae bacterium]